LNLKPAQANLARVYLKNKINTKGLSTKLKLQSKCKALGSIPTTTKKKSIQQARHWIIYGARPQDLHKARQNDFQARIRYSIIDQLDKGIYT
jgi:hypothetical protein